MSFRFRWLLAVMAAGLAGSVGCQHCCRKAALACPPSPSSVPAGVVPGYPQGDLRAPSAPQPLPPAPSATLTPPPASLPPGQPPTAPPGGTLLPPPPPEAAAPAPESRGSSPIADLPSEPFWKPAPRSEVRLAVPEPLPTGPEERLKPEPAPSSAAATVPTPTPPMPVGIPQFAQVRQQVAVGIRPTLEGFDWLQAHGYRTVLHLRRAGEDDRADRQLVEARGLRFLSLEVSAQQLTRQLVEDFNRTVTRTENLPLFVYDDNGLFSGALWYLHYRLYDNLTDSEAREKAARFGLRPDGDGDQQTIWLAVQQLLSELSR